MIAWLFGLLFNLSLIYITYSFPPIAMWSGMRMFAITAILFTTAKNRITGNDEKSIEDQRAAYDNLMLKSVRPKKKTKKKIKKRNRLFIHVFYKQYN